MKQLISHLEKVLNWCCLVFLLSMISIGFLAIILRYIFNRPLIWSQELLIALNIWYIFFASSIAFWRARHISLKFIVDKIKSPKIRLYLSILRKLLIAFFLIFLIWGIIKIQPMQMLYKTPALGLPRNYLSVSVGVSAIIMLLMDIYLIKGELSKLLSGDYQKIIFEKNNKVVKN